MIFFTVRKSNHKRYPSNNSADLYIMKALWESTWGISSDHQNKINQRLFLSTDCTDTFVSERPFVKPLLMVGGVSQATRRHMFYTFSKNLLLYSSSLFRVGFYTEHKRVPLFKLSANYETYSSLYRRVQYIYPFSCLLL